MAEENDHTCLLCQAKFADPLDFYEHMMEHGGEDQSEDEDLNHLPGAEPPVNTAEPDNAEERHNSSCGEYPSSPGPISPAFPPPHDYGLPRTDTLAPSANFLAHNISSPQFFEGDYTRHFCFLPHFAYIMQDGVRSAFLFDGWQG
jgi:hypothetical protein